jgi:glycerate 2-kinase
MSVADAVRRAALAAVEPATAILRGLKLSDDLLVAGAEEIDLSGVDRVWLVGAGKAARGMAAGVVEMLGSRIAGGTVAVPDGLGRRLTAIDVWEAGHPLPDTRGLAAASEALQVAQRAGAGDLVLCLLSGGASALWAAPPAGVTIAELRDLTTALLRAGAPIDEINIVRRHLSGVGGGNLARRAAPARTLTLAISDVLGGSPHVIGSGPTSVDPTTFPDALRVIAAYEIRAPAGIRRHLQAGAAGERRETLKPGELPAEPPFHVIASLRDALAMAAEEAVRLGFPATVVSESFDGEARRRGEEVARAALAARNAGQRSVLIWGGETTVEVRGNGRGGRNQELALAAALAIENEPGITITAFATDGIDGPTPAAGATVDGRTAGRGRAAGLDPAKALQSNDSHTFLAACGALLSTGPTGTNVNDLTLAIIE